MAETSKKKMSLEALLDVVYNDKFVRRYGFCLYYSPSYRGLETVCTIIDQYLAGSGICTDTSWSGYSFERGAKGISAAIKEALEKLSQSSVKDKEICALWEGKL